MSYFSSIKFKDENGVPYGIKHINNKPRVSSMPYLYDISEGNVPVHEAWSKIGMYVLMFLLGMLSFLAIVWLS